MGTEGLKSSGFRGFGSLAFSGLDLPALGAL